MKNAPSTHTDTADRRTDISLDQPQMFTTFFILRIPMCRTSRNIVIVCHRHN